MQLDKLTIEVKLFTTKNTLNQDVCGVCNIFGLGSNTYSLAFNSYAGDQQEEVH